MAYFFFLKYLDSLEDFRKNPHVKIPPISPPTNFQSLGIFKNQILFRKEFFLHFQPNRPSAQPAHPTFRPSRDSLFFSIGRSPLSPLGLGLIAGPTRPHDPASRLLPPLAPEQRAQDTTTGRPRAAPLTAPTTFAGGKIMAA
jgi:hypothetical protein